MNPSDDFQTLPGLPLTAPDLTTATTWHQRFRSIAVAVGIIDAGETGPEVIVIGEPGGEDRWWLYRSAGGVWLVDRTDDTEALQFETMEEAFQFAWDTEEADKAAAIAAIPETLIPDVGL